ncbi:hypothetical protein Ccr2_gp127c [Caulobacter phage Ccr2]|nr:hypothetical protein Ccr10_gp128c [Caulobacter phage Ccr10]ARB14002.1 hypothetical protein Ccr2_gp127c [Caulobacter phage Ccr2]ARB14690.1 hypothetical protein Ccr29_gp134 [Caulobacter phage Ccr29]
MKKRRWFPKIKVFYRPTYDRDLKPNGRRKVVQVRLTQYSSIRDALYYELWFNWLCKWNHHRTMQNIALGGCEHCGTFWSLGMVGSMTCYHWDGKGEDPNRDRRYCPDCTEKHIDYWEGMWRDYYGGRL